MSADVLRRILIRANDDSAGPDTLFLFDEALADAERSGGRAAVERIRERLLPMLGTAPWGIRHLTEHDLTSVLDEEAARG